MLGNTLKAVEISQPEQGQNSMLKKSHELTESDPGHSPGSVQFLTFSQKTKIIIPIVPKTYIPIA